MLLLLVLDVAMLFILYVASGIVRNCLVLFSYVLKNKCYVDM